MKTVRALVDMGRLLVTACAATAVCLMVVAALSSSAQAHAGHKHPATEQPAVGGTITAPERSTTLALTTDTQMPVDLVQSGKAAAAEQEASQELRADLALAPKALNTCGSLCGSCTSMSCCVAVLVSHCGAAFAPRTVNALLPPIAHRMAGAAVAPLQRPPILVC